jgi:hypothetical protein
MLAESSSPEKQRDALAALSRMVVDSPTSAVEIAAAGTIRSLTAFRLSTLTKTDLFQLGGAALKNLAMYATQLDIGSLLDLLAEGSPDEARKLALEELHYSRAVRNAAEVFDAGAIPRLMRIDSYSFRYGKSKNDDAISNSLSLSLSLKLSNSQTLKLSFI